MTWSWLSFLVGAPVWGSLGMLAFALILAGIDADRARYGRLVDSTERKRSDPEDPDVRALDEYRRTSRGA